MKKIILFNGILIGLIIFSSCSIEDENCSSEIWELSMTCNPDEECRYFIEYGPDEDNTTIIETNEATYDFYDQVDCWEGEK